MGEKTPFKLIHFSNETDAFFCAVVNIGKEIRAIIKKTTHNLKLKINVQSIELAKHGNWISGMEARFCRNARHDTPKRKNVIVVYFASLPVKKVASFT